MDPDEAAQRLWRAVKRAAMDFAYEHDLDVEVDSDKREVTIPVERGKYLACHDRGKREGGEGVAPGVARAAVSSARAIARPNPLTTSLIERIINYMR